MSRPKRLIIEYEDGVKEEILFDRIQRPLFQNGASRIIESPESSGVCKPKHQYILLRWKDGWQEVVSADKDQLDLKRYYVLERKEKVGKMAFEAKEDWPYLLKINRLPKELESILIVGEGDSRFYDFRRDEEAQASDFVDFEKAERHLKIDSKDAELFLADLLDSMKAEIERDGFGAGDILAKNSEEQRRIFKGLSRAVGIYAKEKQEDVLGFFKLMLKRLSTAKGELNEGTDS